MDSSPAPRVSVIVRTKDRPRLLAEALESLRAQTFRDFEVVVVNDGGAEPRPEAEGLSLRVVSTEPPRGRARALNAGLAAARGRFVAYLDDDDLYLPDHLETLERFLSGTDAYGAAFTDVRVDLHTLGEDGRYGASRTLMVYGRSFDRARLLSSNTIPLIGLMHEREIARAAGGFDESFDLYEDWDFLIRLSERTRLHRIPKVTAVYRLRDDGTNATTETPWKSPKSDAARRQVLAKHWPSHTPETQAVLVDTLSKEAEDARHEAAASSARREQELAAERSARSDEVERIGRERDAALVEAGRAREESLLVRADAARQIQASGEREAALAARAAELERTLQAIQGSRAFRLVAPWWRLKAFLRR